MSHSFYDQWSQASQTSLSPWLEFNNITYRLYGDLSRQNLKIINELMQCYTEAIQECSHARGLDEILSAQSRIATKSSSNLAQHAQHIWDTFLESSTQYQKWMEKGMEHYYRHEQAMNDKMRDATQKMRDVSQRMRETTEKR